MRDAGRKPRLDWARLVGVAVVAVACNAHAMYISSDERIEAQAALSVQNTAQHAGTEKIEWVQERNELKLGLRYFLVPVDRDLLLLHRPRFSVLWRGRYDSIFDIREVYQRRHFNRDDFRFPEGEVPREMFLDFDLAHPLDWMSFRIGKQQVVWGEADLFRSLDIINPLRLDQSGLIGENFDDYREPLWIAKGLIRFGQIGPFAETGMEYFYSPNSRPLSNRIVVSEGFRLGVDENICPGETPGHEIFKCLRPQSLPFRRTRYPWEVSRVGPYKTDAGNQADLNPVDAHPADGHTPRCTPNQTDALHSGCGDFVYILTDDWPRKVLDFNASMAGTRLFFKTFGGIDVSLDYIFKRTEVPGTKLAVNDLFCPPNDPEALTPAGAVLCRSNGQPNPRPSLLLAAAQAMATGDANGNGLPDGEDALIKKCVFDHQAEIILDNLHGPTPYDTAPGDPTQVNGFSGCEKVTFWYPWTHIMGATATYNDYDITGFIWRLEESYSTREPRTHLPALANEKSGHYPDETDFSSHEKRNTGVWRSMIGFDYLRAPFPNLPKSIRNQWWSTFLKDQWFFTVQFLDEYYSNTKHQLGLLDSLTDRQQHFNPLATFAMTGFFMHEKARPFIAVGYDVNAQFPVTYFYFDYFVTSRFQIRISDIEYLGSKSNESFVFLHKYADRDNTFIRLTYFLL